MIPSPMMAVVLTTDGLHFFLSRFRFSMASMSITALFTFSRSALFTTKMSPISIMPALMACMSSPNPGANTTTMVWATFTISTSDWPAPTVSTITTSFPEASKIFTASFVALAKAPTLPRVAILRIKTPSSVLSSCMRTRSPKKAPPVKGLDGSTATTPTVFPCLLSSSTSFCISVLFPEPGGPVMPTMWALPVCG